jgi:CHAT domain-containing protein
VNLSPLPFSKDEVEGAATWAGQRASVYVGAAATKARFEAVDMSQFKIVHLALHASGDENPAHCFLAFCFDSKQDGPAEGLLGMRELATLRMSADLVVLSACETARGAEMIGEGVRSLSQAVILNGARSVLASEWKVDDYATAEFMKEFYRNLSSGASKAAALRSAKLGFLRDRELSHPRYWAAFVLNGNGLDGVDIRPAGPVMSKAAVYSFAAVILVLFLVWRLAHRIRRV